jgi:O-antigen/teichoic acid export membrane protein
LIGLVVAALVVAILSVTGHTQWVALAAGGFAFALISGWERIVDGLQNAARARAVVAWHQALRQWLRPLIAIVLLAAIAHEGAIALAGFGVASIVVLASQLVLARGRLTSSTTEYIDAAVARDEVKRVLHYAAPFAAFGVFSWLQFSLDRWALQIFGTSQEVGLYAVLLQLGVYPLTLLGAVFGQLAGPIVFARVGAGTDPSRVRESARIIWALVGGFLALSALAGIGAWVLSGPVFDLLAAPDYRQASWMLPLAVAAGAAFSVGQLLCLLPMAAGKSTALVSPKIGTAILSVPLYLLGAWQAGMQGVLLASIVVGLVYIVWSAGVAWQVSRRAGAS